MKLQKGSQILNNPVELAAVANNFISFRGCSIQRNVQFIQTAVNDGILPDFNVGTNGGTTCAAKGEQAVVDLCNNAAPYTSVLNGRFKGGWTTRHYADPASGQNCVQMELAQSTYMQQSSPWTYDVSKADHLRTHLKTILETLNKLALSGALTR